MTSPENRHNLQKIGGWNQHLVEKLNLSFLELDEN